MPRIFSCPDCERVFDRSAKLSLHQLIHSQNRPFICGFAGCGKAFNRAHHLKQHELQHSSDPRPFKCTFCGKGFATSTLAKRHVKNLHAEAEGLDKQVETNLKASIDQEETQPNSTHTTKSRILIAKSGSLNKTPSIQRKDSEHTKETEIAINVAIQIEKSTEMHSQISKNIRKNKNAPLADTPLKCPHCPFEFTKIQALISHKKTHTPCEKPRNYACSVPECGRKFFRHYDLERHIKSAHPC